MKKSLIAFSTVGLLLSGFAPVGNVLADGVETVTEENGDQAEQDLVHLTLDTVVKRALEDDSNLLLLSYQMDLLGDRERITEDDIDETEEDIDDLRGIPGVRGGLYDMREQYLNLLEQLPYQERQLVIQEDTTKEAVKFGITARYVQLLSSQEQLSLSKQSMDWKQEDLRIAKLQHQVGLASLYDVRDLEREIESLDRTIEDNQVNYEQELLKLLVDLNIPYSEDITLAEIEAIEEIEVELPEKPENMNELIEASYQMQAAKENVKVAELTLEQQWYNGLMTRKENQVKVEEAKINVENLEKELTNKINALYDDTEALILSYQDALRNLANLEEDQQRMRLQYQVGLVSKYDYEKVARGLKQTEIELELTKKNYFTMLEQIDALQRGFIQ